MSAVVDGPVVDYRATGIGARICSCCSLQNVNRRTLRVVVLLVATAVLVAVVSTRVFVNAPQEQQAPASQEQAPAPLTEPPSPRGSSEGLSQSTANSETYGSSRISRRPTKIPSSNPVTSIPTSKPSTALPTQYQTTVPTTLLTSSIQMTQSLYDEQQCTEYSDTFNLCADNDVPYYHCNQNQNTLGTDILLLHGASFNKENWRRKGILDDFCKSVTVVASDLSILADSKIFIDMLDRLEAAGIVRLPLTVVTPSASGLAMVKWIQGQSDIESLPKYVSTWVPVAPYNVFSLLDSQLMALRDLDMSILAIHGDGDATGKGVSERLGDVAGASVVQLEGGHAVYLQSPSEFVQVVLMHLDILEK